MAHGRFQHTSYVQSIQLLLIPITTDEELHDMMDDTDNALWTSDDMADALRKRLGGAYQAYMRTIWQMEGITKSLAEKLDIEGADKVSQHGLEAIVLANPPSKKHGILEFQFSKRVKFTMKRQRVRKLLEELEICNRRLDTYANKAEKLEEPYKAEKKPKFALPLRSIEENAARLYDVLSRTWCSAHSSHHAGLLLEQRLVRKRKRMASQQGGRAEECDVNCFGISLLQSPSTRKWLEVEFRLAEAASNSQQVSSAVQLVVSAPPPTPGSQAPYLDPSRLQVVTNLCSVLQQPSHPWIGFCLDSEGHLRGAYPAQPRALAYVENAVSLGDMLVKRQGSLSKEEAYSLSITLSSSLLQLSHTPWLGQSWDKADIIFLRAKDGSGLFVDMKHPYLTREHTSNNTGVIRHNAYPGNDCSKLLSLGVLLMEIDSGQPIENLRLPEDLGPNNEPNELSNLQAARR